MSEVGPIIPLDQLVEIKALAGGVELIYLTQPTIIILRLTCDAARELIERLEVAIDAAAMMKSQQLK